MINLFTGTPGSGKTAYAVKEMLALVKEGRPLYVHGIPELRIEHTPVICTSQHCQVCPTDPEIRKEMLVAEKWDEWAPEGAVLFFDEVQNIYRPRSSSQKPPSSIMAFETHRHKGLDFYLISQSPMLFDSNIRRLVNRHVHLKATWANRQQYEWPECKDSPSQSTNGAIKSNYKLDKRVFNLYKSATLHTKVKRKVPAALYAFFALVVALGFISTSFYNSVKAKTQYADVDNQTIDIKGGSPVASATGGTPIITNRTLNDLDRTPLIANVPESAPIYRDLVKPSDFPVIQGCMQNEKTGDCRCYTQQNTIYETSERQCVLYLQGKRFNPYKTLAENQRQESERVAGFNPQARPQQM